MSHFFSIGSYAARTQQAAPIDLLIKSNLEIMYDWINTPDDIMSVRSVNIQPTNPQPQKKGERRDQEKASQTTKEQKREVRSTDSTYYSTLHTRCTSPTAGPKYEEASTTGDTQQYQGILNLSARKLRDVFLLLLFFPFEIRRMWERLCTNDKAWFTLGIPTRLCSTLQRPILAKFG